VSAIAFTPSTFSNTQDTTVTVTLTLSRGGSGCAYARWFALPNSGAPSTDLVPVSSGSQVYRGTMTVVAGTAPGRYSPTDINGCGSGTGWNIDGGALANVGLVPLTVTGAADTAAPKLTGLTVSTTSADATYGDVVVDLSWSAVDAFSGIGTAYVKATPLTVPAQFPNSPRSKWTSNQGGTLSQGTINNGTWKGTLTLAGGSATVWELSVYLGDRVGNDVELTGAQLKALGFPSQITTRTTALPPKPTNVKAISGLGWYGNWGVQVTGTIQQPGKPYVSEWAATGTAPCGGLLTAPDLSPWAINFVHTGAAGWCAVTLKAVNGAGSSAGVTVYAWVGAT
jgi:hypothetical protein